MSLRILAEHGRTMTFLVADGVVPSNEERGYVLRRIIRRAVRHAYLLGAEQQLVTPALVDATVEVMGERVPRAREAARPRRGIVVRREEERFRQTLARGLDLLDGMLDEGDVTGDRRVLPARHARVSRSTSRVRSPRSATAPSTSTGFEALMDEQRTRAREAHTAAGGKGEGAPVELYRELLDELGPTDFTGRQEYETTGAKVRALVVGRRPRSRRRGRRPRSTSCSTARRSTPSPVARSATPA